VCSGKIRRLGYETGRLPSNEWVSSPVKRRGIGGLAGSRFGAGGKRAGSMQPSGVDESVQDESSLDGEDTMSSEK